MSTDRLTINRMNNEYRALLSEAEDVRYKNGYKGSREEGLCYQRASQIAGNLATVTIGAEAQHWLDAQSSCNGKMRDIWRELHPEPKPDTPSPAKSPTPAAVQEAPAEDSIAKWIQEDPGYGFDMVAGMEEIKDLFQDCLRAAESEELSRYLGLPSVLSYFFYGPPGCGKTYIIEAFAHELMLRGYTYLKLGSADIHSKFSGEADKIVERAFDEAVNHAPCLLFMDEIDGVCQNRELPNLSDFNMQLTTTFLTSFNRLSRANKDFKSVIFIGATNFPSNVDTAMLDRVELVRIPLPDLACRTNSFQRKFDSILSLSGISYADMATATEGYNQRDINRLVDHVKKLLLHRVTREYPGSSGVQALRDGHIALDRELFEQALELYHPSPKDGVMRQLAEFEERVHSL